MHLIERAGLTEQVELRVADVEAEWELEGMEAGGVKRALSSEKREHLELVGGRKHCAEQQDVCDIKVKAYRWVQRFL